MNELSVIGSLCLPKDFWDRHKGKHCNSLEKNQCTAKGYFNVQRNDFGERSSLFCAVFSETSVGYFDTKVAQGFVRTTVKYSVKSSDKFFSMRKGYSEIDFA